MAVDWAAEMWTVNQGAGCGNQTKPPRCSYRFQDQTILGFEPYQTKPNQPNLGAGIMSNQETNRKEPT